MASLKEVKNRINSVTSTRQITSAMKMIASNKLRKAQTAFLQVTPYENSLTQMLDHLTEFEIRNSVESNFPIAEKRDVKKLVIIAITSNNSFCGSFNASVIRYLDKLLVSKYKQLSPQDILIIPIGKKIREYVKRLDCNIYDQNLDEFVDKPNYDTIADLSDYLSKEFLDGNIDAVEVVYQHFKNRSVQLLTHKVFLPYNVVDTHDIHLNVVDDETDPEIVDLKNKIDSKIEEDKANFSYQVNYMLEPDRHKLMEYIINKVIRMNLFYIVIDSIAAEHAARTMAMQVATDNAEELLKELNIQYNKTRQQQITGELLDLIGGNIL